jgi:hypothetical protein
MRQNTTVIFRDFAVPQVDQIVASLAEVGTVEDGTAEGAESGGGH